MPVVFHFFAEYTVFGNPYSVVWKMVFEVSVIEIFARINNRLHTIMLFDHFKPVVHAFSQFFNTLMSGIILNIQNRNKISGFQKGVFYKVLCLQRAVFIRAVIVISATNQQTGFGIFPVIFKLHINTVYSHGRTDKHKIDGIFLIQTIGYFPIDAGLIMRNIKTKQMFIVLVQNFDGTNVMYSNFFRLFVVKNGFVQILKKIP